MQLVVADFYVASHCNDRQKLQWLQHCGLHVSAVEQSLPTDSWAYHSGAAGRFTFSIYVTELPWLFCGC